MQQRKLTTFNLTTEHRNYLKKMATVYNTTLTGFVSLLIQVDKERRSTFMMKAGCNTQEKDTNNNG